MRNCLILGSGRSGTSMLAGILHQAGYFLGDKLYLPNESNPKGIFEWGVINSLNEDILSKYSNYSCLRFIKRIFNLNTIFDPGKNQHWLLSLPQDTSLTNVKPQIHERIKKAVRHESFCYKDPRFSYTLQVWKPFLPSDIGILCVFREPDITIESILKECASSKYLSSLKISPMHAYRVWIDMYTHIFNNYIKVPEQFFFIHYDQIYNGVGLESLSKFLRTTLQKDFVDPLLKRSVSSRSIPTKAKYIYKKLCRLANYNYK